MMSPCHFDRIDLRVIVLAVAPIGRLIDSRQYPSKSVEIGHPLRTIEIVSADLPRRTEARSLPDPMFAAGFFIIDGLRRK
jgi:hypothetical protein